MECLDHSVNPVVWRVHNTSRFCECFCDIQKFILCKLPIGHYYLFACIKQSFYGLFTIFTCTDICNEDFCNWIEWTFVVTCLLKTYIHSFIYDIIYMTSIQIDSPILLER